MPDKNEYPADVKETFFTLCKAVTEHNVCLVPCIEESTGAIVYFIDILNRENEEIFLVAQLIGSTISDNITLQ